MKQLTLTLVGINKKMKELTINIPDKIRVSFKWQRNIYFAIGLLLISGGINILSSNWFFVFIGILSENFLNKSIGGWDIIIGIFLILLGILIVYFGIISARILKHDSKKVDELRELIDYDKIRNILSQIKNYHYYLSDQSSYLYLIQHFLEKPENMFLSKTINEKAQNLKKRLDEYSSFRTTNFFVYPSNQTRQNPSYGLQPRMDINKELQVFNQTTEDKLNEIRTELIHKTEIVEQALTDLILKIKQKLGK